MRTQIEDILYDTKLDWTEVPLPITRLVLKDRLQKRKLTRKKFCGEFDRQGEENLSKKESGEK